MSEAERTVRHTDGVWRWTVISLALQFINLAWI